MSTKRSGFGPGFSKDVEAVIISFDRGFIMGDEVRTNLRIAGMVLRDDQSLMEDFRLEEPELIEEFDPEEEVIDE
jgi:hypothetical protein